MESANRDFMENFNDDNIEEIRSVIEIGRQIIFLRIRG